MRWKAMERERSMRDRGMIAIGHYNPLVKKVCGRDYLRGAVEGKRTARKKKSRRKGCNHRKGIYTRIEDSLRNKT